MKGTSLGVIVLGVVAAGAGAAVASGVTWLEQMRAAVDRSLPQLNAAARRLVVAHAAYESGFGKARAAQHGFNVFNITAGSWWKSMGYPVWLDVGGDTDGAGVRIDQTWRVYASLEAAVADYFAFLGPAQNGGRYVAARDALVRGDLQDFVSKLSAAGYFALARDKYAAGMTATLAKVTA